jgi:glutathione peroxidase
MIRLRHQDLKADGAVRGAALCQNTAMTTGDLCKGLGLACCILTALAAAQSPSPRGTVASFYDMKTSYLNGTPADLGQFRGKVALVVNVASQCGFTPQYEGLEKLHRELSGRGFSVLGFPSNDFGEQEPGTPDEIATFCKLTYDVTFPMFSKLVTVAGPAQSPIYRFLGGSGHLPAWNFSKYVIGKDGRVVAFFPSEVTPDAPELRRAITTALAAK